MKESGMRLPQTHLVDPHAALRGMKFARRFLLPRLPAKERKLRRKLNTPAPPAYTPPASSRAEVF
jgi:hypothetical protein